VNKKIKVFWTAHAKHSFSDAIKYISKKSPAGARKVRRKIVELVDSLYTSPQKFSSEFYLEDEPEDYRSVVVYSYKIIYEVKHDTVIIIDIFHTSRNPTEIKK
jgi:plasmid stabilization system protein ParE